MNYQELGKVKSHPRVLQLLQSCQKCPWIVLSDCQIAVLLSCVPGVKSCVPGVKRGRGRGRWNLDTRERVGHAREKDASHALARPNFPFPFPF